MPRYGPQRQEHYMQENQKISVLDESAILERVVSDYSFALDTLDD